MRMKFCDKPGDRTPTRDQAVKTLVATFAGNQYVAERDGENLQIYLITADGDLGSLRMDVSSPSFDSRAPRRQAGLAALNRRNAEFYGSSGS